MLIIQGALASYISFPGLLACCYVAYKTWEEDLALGYFLKGFKIALEPSLFLVEIVRCLVTLKSTKGILLLLR